MALAAGRTGQELDGAPAEGKADLTDLTDVDRHSFCDILPQVADALRDCDFVAFDCEMTGLFLDTNSHSTLDDMNIRYAKVHASAQHFIVNQFGLAAFKRSKGTYAAKTFNFNLFPRPFQGVDRRFVSQASSLDYLAQHNFDFNKMVYRGISFMPLRLRDKLLRDVDRPSQYVRREITKPEDQEFAANVADLVTEWYRNQCDETTFDIAGDRAWKRALIYQTLEQLDLGDGTPGFYAEKIGSFPSESIRVTRATATELQAHKDELKRLKREAIQEAAGFVAVMELIRDAKKPVVGHNMLFDVVYVLNQFIGNFQTWPECKQAVEEWFPGGVYDTKHVSKQLEAASPGLVPSTTLGPMYTHFQSTDPDTAHMQLLKDAATDGGRLSMPRVEHADGFTRYAGVAGAAFAHEAGFDAFMTGACLTQLLALAAATQAVQRRESLQTTLEAASTALLLNASASDSDFSALRSYRGRVNMMNTDMPYCNLTGTDPELERSHVVIVRHEDASALPLFKDLRLAVQSVSGGLGSFRLEPLHGEGVWGAMAVSFGPGNDASTIVPQLAKTRACRNCTVASWADYARWKASATADETDLRIISGEGAFASKRRRTLSPGSAAPFGGDAAGANVAAGTPASQEQDADPRSTTSCSIM